MNHRIRVSLLLVALVCGGSASAVSGCLIPDYCIFYYKNGVDWCRRMTGAMMWPAGQPDLAMPIEAVDGLPTGCRCMNIAEEEILMSESPVEAYIELSGELAVLARQECAALVPDGFEHNCMTLEGAMASSVDAPYLAGESTECIGECSYGNPPPFKDCPSPDPTSATISLRPAAMTRRTRSGPRMARPTRVAWCSTWRGRREVTCAGMRRGIDILGEFSRAGFVSTNQGFLYIRQAM